MQDKASDQALHQQIHWWKSLDSV